MQANVIENKNSNPQYTLCLTELKHVFQLRLKKVLGNYGMKD